jgi:hypothetical protein
VGLLFVVAVYFSDSIKIPALVPVGLALLAGWGLGRWGTAMHILPGAAVAIAAWLTIAGGEVISTLKANRDRVAYLRTLPKYQDKPDDIIEGLKRALDTAPPILNEEDRRQREKIRDDIEQGEMKHQEWLAELTFYGFLQSRVPKAWGKWGYPWPALFWLAEIVVGSTLGAGLTLTTLRNATQRGLLASAQTATAGDERANSDHE